MKFLVTGFEPFGGEARNPSAEVVEALPGAVAGAEIIKLILPTTRFEAPERVERRTAAHRLRRGYPHRQGRHFVHSQRRYATGVFCGNSENLSKRPDGRAKSAAEGDGRDAAGIHGRHCAGHERKPDHPGRQTDRRGDPCVCTPMIPPPKKECFLNFLSQLIELCEAKQEKSTSFVMCFFL